MSAEATSLSVGTFGWGVLFDVEDYTRSVGSFGWSGGSPTTLEEANAIFFGMNF